MFQLIKKIKLKINKKFNYILKIKKMINFLSIVWLIFIGICTLFLLLSLFSYNHDDPGWTIANNNIVVKNYLGVIGAYTANSILTIFGFVGFLFPFLIMFGIWLICLEQKRFTLLFLILRILGGILTIFFGTALTTNIFSIRTFSSYMPEGMGGILGQEILKLILFYFDNRNSIRILLIGFSSGLILFLGIYKNRSIVFLIYFISLLLIYKF